jgi:hypothetical protein
MLINTPITKANEFNKCALTIWKKCINVNKKILKIAMKTNNVSYKHEIYYHVQV